MRRWTAAVLSVLLLVIARANGASAGLPGPSYYAGVVVAPTQLQCDGDSARLSGRILNLDGTPASHVPVAIAIWNGTVTVKGKTSDHVAITETNSDGFVQARLTPTPGTTGQVRYIVWPGNVENVEFNPFIRHALACSLGIDGTPLTGHVWDDRNADGIQDAAEGDVVHVAMTVTGASGGSRGEFADHTTYTDSKGNFGWHISAPVPLAGLCVDRSKYQIVSVNGEPISALGVTCIEFDYGVFDPFGHYQIGVHRR